MTYAENTSEILFSCKSIFQMTLRSRIFCICGVFGIFHNLNLGFFFARFVVSAIKFSKALKKYAGNTSYMLRNVQYIWSIFVVQYVIWAKKWAQNPFSTKSSIFKGIHFQIRWKISFEIHFSSNICDFLAILQVNILSN